jgi:hypothetical protein
MHVRNRHERNVKPITVTVLLLQRKFKLICLQNQDPIHLDIRKIDLA